jgi:DnaJ-class molecular chaperone
MQSASTCPTCGGSGQILDKKTEADSQEPRRRTCFNQNPVVE